MQLSDLQVDDKVIAQGGGFGKEWRQVETITKVTKTQITTNRARYTRSHGRMVGGGGFGGSWIDVTTAEQIAEVRRENVRNWKIAALVNIKWKTWATLSDEKLTEIMEIVNRE